jgi:hypothetical protein
MKKLVETWLGAEALMFIVAAVVHSGLAHSESRIIAAVIVEVVCAIMLLTAASAVRHGKPFARRAAMAAHGVAISAVGLGLVALWLGIAANTTLGVAYQRGMLGLLIAVFLLLASPLGAIAFRRPRTIVQNEDWFMRSQPMTPGS